MDIFCAATVKTFVRLLLTENVQLLLIFCLNKRVAASEKIIMVPSNFEKHKICSNGTKSLLIVN